MDNLSLLMYLSALAFILGFIAGISVCKQRPDDDRPRCPDPLARDVRTPGHKLVAVPPRVKPSSAWPRTDRPVFRTPVQRVQRLGGDERVQRGNG